MAETKIILSESSLAPFHILGTLPADLLDKIAGEIEKIPSDISSVGTLGDFFMTTLGIDGQAALDVCQMFYELYTQEKTLGLDARQTAAAAQYFYKESFPTPQENPITDWDSYQRFLERMLKAPAIADGAKKYRGHGLVFNEENVFKDSNGVVYFVPYDFTGEEAALNVMPFYKLRMEYIAKGQRTPQFFTLSFTERSLQGLKASIIKMEQYAERLEDDLKKKPIKLISSN